MSTLRSIKNAVNRILGRHGFEGSANYWENRYRANGNSGAGSYNKLAEFKANFLNRFVREHRTPSVIEWGCGDGNQLLLADYPRYLGLDVAPTAVALCRKLHAGRPQYRFKVIEGNVTDRASLALSLDVIYHLVEDKVYHAHLRNVFNSADDHVIIYSCDLDEDATAYSAHVRPRRFTKDVAAMFPDWELTSMVKNAYPLGQFNEIEGSWSDFFVFSKRATR